MKGKIKTFSDKKEFVTSRLTLKTEKQKFYILNVEIPQCSSTTWLSQSWQVGLCP